jgi:hypothetical protein
VIVAVGLQPTESPRRPKMPGGTATLVYVRPQALRGEDGRSLYTVRAFAEPVGRRSWIGWLEFSSPTGKKRMRTERETTQPELEAVAYWAAGLGTQYLRGALARARRRSRDLSASGPVLVKAHDVEVARPDGVSYRVRTYAREEQRGTWVGWIEFHPIGRAGPILRSGNETSQPDLPAVEYWAAGLEPIYFDGAFARAVRSAKRKGGLAGG